jgi:hypothetical protein
MTYQAGPANQETMQDLEGIIIRNRGWRTPMHKSAMPRSRKLPHQQARPYLVAIPSCGLHL